MMKYLNHYMKTNGYTMVELLFSLMIMSLSITLISSVLTIVPKLMNEDERIQDEIALFQIRHMTLLSEELSVSFDTLEMRYLNRDVVIYQDRNRLIKAEGYQILMQNIESVEFVQEGGCIYMIYEKVNQDEEKKRFITCN